MDRVQRAALALLIICATSVQAENGPAWLRHRRQFPAADWVPLQQPCPTCRPLTDPADIRTNVNDIGLVPPRPPPVTRQVHGTGNFFNQQFPQSQYQQQLSFQYNQNPNLLQFPQAQQFFTPQQQAAFLPQTYLNNPQLLLNENPQLLPLVSNPQLLLAQKQQAPAVNSVSSGEKKEENQIRFKAEQSKTTKPPQNIRLEQEALAQGLPPPTRLELPFNSAPAQFLQQPNLSQQQLPPPLQQPIPAQFGQLQLQPRPDQQGLLQVNPPNPFLSTGFRNHSNDIQIPGLDKEEIQLLYVPVETLRQRGTLQGHQIDDISFNVNNKPLQQLIRTPQGHFITEPPSPQIQSQFNSPLQQQFNTQFNSPPQQQFNTQFNPLAPVITPPPALSQSLPLRESPQQFSTERPVVKPTTEQVVTIQPRPVSTVRQQNGDALKFSSRPSPTTRLIDQTATTPIRNNFLSNEHLTKVTNALRNEVTPPIPQPTIQPPPPAAIAQFQQFNLPTPSQQTFEQLQNGPEQVQLLPQAPPRHRFTPTPRPLEPVTEASPPPTTTLAPHQPPLSIYIVSDNVNTKVVDVLRALKGADTIAVLDNFSPNSPRVFVGPANLNAPIGITKFELPYLSNLEQNKVERKQNIPFFVAPLNFVPPQGYSKIPFPAPHVGSVVVSTDTSVRSSPIQEHITTPEAPPPEPTINVEPEVVTTALPETTTVRSRGRRPNNYRTSARKPVSTRQRATVRPTEEETTPPITENQVNQEFLREPQEERKRVTMRRQRYRTTTEAVQETVVTEAPQFINTFAPQPPQAEIVQQISPNDIPQAPAQRLVEPIHPPANFNPQQQFSQDIRSPQPPQVLNQFRQHSFADSEFNPPPAPPSFEFQTPRLPATDFNQSQRQNDGFPAIQQPQLQHQQRFQQQQQQFPQTVQQGIFEVSTQPIQQDPLIESNGDSGFQQQQLENSIGTTLQPISSTQFADVPETETSSEEVIRFQTEPVKKIKATTIVTYPTTTTTTSAPTTVEKLEEPEEVEKVVDVPRKSSRYSHPSVSSSRGHAKSEAVKSRSHNRSRNRFTTPSTTTTVEDQEEEEVAPVEPSAFGEEATSSPTTEGTKATNKYQSHFHGRTRKPLRSTTPRTESSSTPTPTRSYTVRPLRRSTSRTSVSTKRIRKPTTPSSLDIEEEEGSEHPTFQKKARPTFGPSGDSNEVYDEQTHPQIKPKSRKPYFQKPKLVEETTTHSTLSTKTYQERKDIGHFEEDVKGQEDWSPSHTGPEANDGHDATLPPSGPSGPTAHEDFEEKKISTDERKKARDPELTKKPRRRLRVRVQKRPQDNFETAESQNHRSVSNALLQATPTKSNTPDIYSFSQGEFNFEANKFIGTQHKGHVRNITADILENTSTFSSPGTDTEIHHVTIASESTTVMPDASETPVVTEKTINLEDSTANTEPAVITREIVEQTTMRHETTHYEEETATTDVEELTTTLENDEVGTTVPAETSTLSSTTTASSEVPEVQKQPKVLKTSTTTQVSHETEICYKGKCIKTNSDNPDQALKQLVEAANLEDFSKMKS